MKEEILAAVMFFIRFIEKSDKFPKDQIENFKKHLTELLIQRFEKHWFPELPSKGQAYRCIRVNGISPVDLTLERAASKCGSSFSDLRLPPELTVWVDPSEVCYRLGESEGSYCTLATFPSDHSSSSSSETSSPTNSPPSTPLQDRFRKINMNNRQQAIQHKYWSTELPINTNKHRNNYPLITQYRYKKEVNYSTTTTTRQTPMCISFPVNSPFLKNNPLARTYPKNSCRVW